MFQFKVNLSFIRTACVKSAVKCQLTCVLYPFLFLLEEAELDEPTVVAEENMASIMGFDGFGKQVTSQAIEDKTKKRLSMMQESTRRDSIVQEKLVVGDRVRDNYNDGDNNDASDVDSGEIEAIDSSGPPISHEIDLKHGSKAVTALDLDPSGARIVTGKSPLCVVLPHLDI